MIVNQLDEPKTAAEALLQLCGQRIKITRPMRGAKRDLLKLAEQNYRYRIGLGAQPGKLSA